MSHFDKLIFISLAISFTIILIFLASFWKIFTKAGKPGWVVFIPIYNWVVLIKICGRPLWWLVFFFMLIISPFMDVFFNLHAIIGTSISGAKTIGSIFLIAGLLGTTILYIDLLKKFGRPVWHVILLLLFGFIYLPYLAFSRSVTYQE